MEIVIYDGIGKPLAVAPHERIETVLKHAEELFGASMTNSLSLFTESGRVLADDQTIEHSGLSANEKLFLRPRPEKAVFDVIIFYNGIKKPLKVHLHEIIKQVLQNAIVLFAPLPNPHLLSLFTEAGAELPDNKTVKEVGLRPEEKLLLRPSAVRGG
jgi:hypothetical protein